MGTDEQVMSFDNQFMFVFKIFVIFHKEELPFIWATVRISFSLLRFLRKCQRLATNSQ